MDAPALPTAISKLAGELAALPGAVAVVLGGSRADGTHRPDSDWDLGLYYRASERRFDPTTVRDLGHPGYVSRLGEWGPIVHGGAWLTAGDTAVDVLFRDLDEVEGWIADANAGRFAVLMQNGYVVGAPTYLPVGELATCRPLAGGALPRPEFPDALAAAAPGGGGARERVAHVRAHARARERRDVCCAGMLVDAALSAGHARLCARREWARNEKRLVERAGLDAVQPLLARAGRDAGRARSDGRRGRRRARDRAARRPLRTSFRMRASRMAPRDGASRPSVILKAGLGPPSRRRRQEARARRHEHRSAQHERAHRDEPLRDDDERAGRGCESQRSTVVQRVPRTVRGAVAAASCGCGREHAP